MMKLAALTASLLFPSLALAEVSAEPEIVLGEVGLHCPYRTAGSVPAPNTAYGAVDEIDGEPAAISQTTIIPALLDMGFGVEYRLAEGVSLPSAEVQLTHPPMGPNSITEQRWTTHPSSDDMGFTIYRFDFPEEVVIGKWTFELVADGKSLFKAEFDVIPAPPGITFESLCMGGSLLS